MKYTTLQCKTLIPTDFKFHILLTSYVQILKETANMCEYKVGINVIIANYVHL